MSPDNTVENKYFVIDFDSTFTKVEALDELCEISLKDNPEKMTQVNKQLMEKNLTYMKHSMKPMLFTFIPIIVIFGWMRVANMGK